MSEFVAPFILRSEFECHHCGRVPYEINWPPDERSSFYNLLFESFGWFREDWGKPVNITSGYRCPAHNYAIGGTEMSIHIFGGALDMKFKDDEETARAARTIDDSAHDLRMGVYLQGKSRIHIDVGYLVMPRLSEFWVQGERFGDKYNV